METYHLANLLKDHYHNDILSRRINSSLGLIGSETLTLIKNVKYLFKKHKITIDLLRRKQTNNFQLSCHLICITFTSFASRTD